MFVAPDFVYPDYKKPLEGHIDSTNNTNLIQKWHTWAKRAHGPGEGRDLALIRLLDCLERSASVLDLSGLNLTELPELPPGIEGLNASHNELTALFTIPTGLECLDVSHNLLEYLPSIPSTLQELNIAHNKFETLPIIDHALQRVDISNNPLDCKIPKIIHYIWLGN
ncbi:hypothetical protein [Sodalis sp. dw_96]|uniref:hypothetical protein n=1 Tax=Sodalis sp. dw_96 TaxID=2719794 RepID=UPI001BD2113C|nr:hypothetical protein [Sodalis sp. dw_96]